MSGLCGTFSTARASVAPAILRDMATALTLLDQTPQQSLFCQHGALAVAGAPGSAHVAQCGQVRVALWGRPRITGHADCALACAELWQQLGPAVCERLNGAFALALIDEAKGQVLLAVDRNGSYQLNYQQIAGGLVFASSVKAMLAHPRISGELDPQALFDYCYFHVIAAPRTILHGQRRLLPGTYLLHEHGKTELRPYWQIRFCEDAQDRIPALKAEFLALLEQSVRAQAMGAETGAFLSGGTDSSTVAALLGQVQDAPARTYSIGFAVDGYDEMAYARIAARHFGTRHHELYVGPEQVVDAIPRLAAAFDQPYGNSSALPAYYCARMASEDGIQRLLGGDGGDELFGGNERYARQALFARYEACPAAVRQLLVEPLLFGVLGQHQHRLLRKGRSYIQQALLPMPDRLESYNLVQAYGPAAMFSDDFLAQVDVTAPLGQLRECYWGPRRLSQMNRMQLLDMRFTLADNDLRKVSTACELAGIEAGFPLLSDELLAFSARLAPQHKLRGTRLRYFFKQALATTLPAEILRKKKHGFGLPFGHWLHTHRAVRELAFDSLVALKGRAMIRPEFIDDLLQNQLSAHPAYHGTMVWVLMMLEQWLQQHTRRNRLPSEVQHGYEIRQG